MFLGSSSSRPARHVFSRLFGSGALSQGVRVIEAVDSIPQYGRCFLSRAVVTRPRLIARDLDDGGLRHETVERPTLVGGVAGEKDGKR